MRRHVRVKVTTKMLTSRIRLKANYLTLPK
jgi:hypothetical protein